MTFSISLKYNAWATILCRESLRLNPVSVGVGRVLPLDTLLGGYNVPKGTICVTQNQVGCHLFMFSVIV